MSLETNIANSSVQLADAKHFVGLPLYPIDMSLFLDLSQISLDTSKVPYDPKLAEYHPTIIAQYALAHWNQYLANHGRYHYKAFLTQAYWLVEHESRIGDDAGGWLNSSPHPDIPTENPWLSAVTQGNGISVLVRAFLLTHEQSFLDVAHRAISTFERDILDGGISAPVGAKGIFFQEVAVYPAAHILNGFMFSLLGLYDHLELTRDIQTEHLIHNGLATMHSLLDEFDMGFWTRSDLLRRRLSSSSHLALQIVLLKVLARYSDCEHCSKLASRWENYQHQFGSRLRYFIVSRCASVSRIVLSHIQRKFFPKIHGPGLVRVCIPVFGFPVTGGTRAVLAGIARVTADIWQLEYMTQFVGPDSERFIIHRFGTRRMMPWQFPTLWLYFFAGFGKLYSLSRHGADYHVILPQDGVYTAAFSSLIAKLAGVRVVCIDHGNLTLLNSYNYRAERIKAIASRNWSLPRRLFALSRNIWYLPSLYLLAKLASCFVDHYLIPGIEGDGVEEDCKRLGLHPSRITRFASMIDIDHHIILDTVSKAGLREKKGIAEDTIVISIICRLAPEKGIDTALEGISLSLSALPQALREQVRVIIAGDGPQRRYVEEEINRRRLRQNCVLWGETSQSDVIILLSISDIFLYTSIRGACFSMSVLEAMASGCAVIASTQPLSNKYLLAEGRGIVVPPGDPKQTAKSLVCLISNLELCRKMGKLSRDYIEVQHNPTVFKRTLMRTTYWAGLDAFLNTEMRSER